MRALADADRIRAFMRALGRASRAPARVYLTGGATAVLSGWRTSTIDVDLKLVPEDDALLRAIPEVKESLQINLELPADRFHSGAGGLGRPQPIHRPGGRAGVPSLRTGRAGARQN